MGKSQHPIEAEGVTVTTTMQRQSDDPLNTSNGDKHGNYSAGHSDRSSDQVVASEWSLRMFQHNPVYRYMAIMEALVRIRFVVMVRRWKLSLVSLLMGPLMVLLMWIVITLVNQDTTSTSESSYSVTDTVCCC